MTLVRSFNMTIYISSTSLIYKFILIIGEIKPGFLFFCKEVIFSMYLFNRYNNQIMENVESVLCVMKRH